MYYPKILSGPKLQILYMDSELVEALSPEVSLLSWAMASVRWLKRGIGLTYKVPGHFCGLDPLVK